MEISEEQESQNEEQQNWEKNAPFLYDALITNSIESPSLTIEWFPYIEKKDINIQQKLIYGSFNTQENDENYLQVCSIYLPESNNYQQINDPNLKKTIPEWDENRILADMKIYHEGEVNKARVMPQNMDIVATQTKFGDIFLFNLSRKSGEETIQNALECKLNSHTQEGFGLEWNKFEEGQLLTSANDSKICVWQLQKSQNGPINELNFHQGPVNDISWNKLMKNVFCSVGDDKTIAMWDLKASNFPVNKFKGHNSDILTIDFNWFDENQFLTGSDDKIINFWDLRYPTKLIHLFESHEDQVIKVEWSKSQKEIFASSSADKRVILWDVNKIGEEAKAEDMHDGPTEMVFAHGGHQSKVPDISWSNLQDWVIASTEEENGELQIWKIVYLFCFRHYCIYQSENIYKDFDDE